jgi:hypothetical protein
MATICKSIKVTVANDIGKLATITEKIKDAGINICAVVGWAEGDQGHIVITTSDAEKACAAASPVVDKCEFVEGVCVETKNEPGALNAIAQKLADAGINIQCVYAAPGHADSATVVLCTTDDAKAAEIL